MAEDQVERREFPLGTPFETPESSRVASPVAQHDTADAGSSDTPDTEEDDTAYLTYGYDDIPPGLAESLHSLVSRVTTGLNELAVSMSQAKHGTASTQDEPEQARHDTRVSRKSRLAASNRLQSRPRSPPDISSDDDEDEGGAIVNAASASASASAASASNAEQEKVDAETVVAVSSRIASTAGQFAAAAHRLVSLLHSAAQPDEDVVASVRTLIAAINEAQLQRHEGPSTENSPAGGSVQDEALSPPTSPTADPATYIYDEFPPILKPAVDAVRGVARNVSAARSERQQATRDAHLAGAQSTAGVDVGSAGSGRVNRSDDSDPEDEDMASTYVYDEVFNSRMDEHLARRDASRVGSVVAALRPATQKLLVALASAQSKLETVVQSTSGGLHSAASRGVAAASRSATWIRELEALNAASRILSTSVSQLQRLQTELAFPIFSFSASSEPIEQFGVEVHNFSSQYGLNTYSAGNLAGESRVFPRYGDFSQAMVLRTYGPWWKRAVGRRHTLTPSIFLQRHGHDPLSHPETLYTGSVVPNDFVEIEFATSVLPRQVKVFETYNPGSIVHLAGAYRDAEADREVWRTLWRGPPQYHEVGADSRAFSPPLFEAACQFPINVLRIEMEHSGLDYYAELDAVKLVGIPVEILSSKYQPSRQRYSLPKQEPRASMPHAAQREEQQRLASPRGRGRLARQRRGSPDQESAAADLSGSAQDPTAADRAWDMGLLGSKASTAITQAMTTLESACQRWRNELKDTGPTTDGDQLAAEAAATATHVPITSSQPLILLLPSEMLLNIVRFLDPVSVASLASTCTSLEATIGQDLQALKALECRLSWMHTTDEMLQSIAPIVRRNTTALSLDWCLGGSAITPSGAATFFRHAGYQLTSLHVSACPFVTDDVLSTVCSHCRHLTEIDVGRCFNLTSYGMQALARLNNVTQATLRDTCIDAPDLDKVLRAWPNLESLDIGQTPAIMHSAPRIAAIIAEACRKLKHLDMWRSRSLTQTEAVKMLGQLPDLESLDIGWSRDLPLEPVLCALAEKCPKIRKIFVTAIRSTLQQAPIKLAENCPDLEQLDFLGNPSLNRQHIETLLQSCKRLQLVDVSFCRLLSLDDVKALKELYPEVEIKKSFSW